MAFNLMWAARKSPTKKQLPKKSKGSSENTFLSQAAAANTGMSLLMLSLLKKEVKESLLSIRSEADQYRANTSSRVKKVFVPVPRAGFWRVTRLWIFLLL